MPKISYVDGSYCHYENSKININDRGYHFGDAVYEVVMFNQNIFFDFDGHIERLFKSLNSIDITLNFSINSLKVKIKKLIKINKASYGSVYLQVSRGIAPRNHSYNNLKLNPVLIISITEKKFDLHNKIKRVNAITLSDNRWDRPDIKTTQLLPNILAKTKAEQNNAFETIFLDEKDFITEGSSSNIWILNYQNELITRGLDGKILSGITRSTIAKYANKNKIKFVERKFSKNELYNAKEVFLTSASSFVTQIIKVDDYLINNGLVGNVSVNLRKTYIKANEKC
jgi:D-alanine transaminase